MAEIKKEQQRDELHRAIWAIVDELRGSIACQRKKRRCNSPFDNLDYHWPNA